MSCVLRCQVCSASLIAVWRRLHVWLHSPPIAHSIATCCRSPTAPSTSTARQFLTGSYDRTCKLFDTDERGAAEYAQWATRMWCTQSSFNLPYSDCIATGSFDSTAKLWSHGRAVHGHADSGHSSEVVSHRLAR